MAVRFLAIPLALLALAIPAFAYTPHFWAPQGDVGGGDQLVMPDGGILGIRNIQGGAQGLDIAAGNSDPSAGPIVSPPVSVAWDVGGAFKVFNGRKRRCLTTGRAVIIYDCRGHRLAYFGPRGIRFYKRLRLRGR